VSRLRAPRHHVLPLHEHSGALLHRLSFDARNNMPRIGRVLIAQGRDAADVPITHTFGPNTLVSFKVWTDEVS
jgi:hypothetical protein